MAEDRSDSRYEHQRSGRHTALRLTLQFSGSVYPARQPSHGEPYEGKWACSVKVAKRLGLRALLIGTSVTWEKENYNVLALPYVPYSHVFPKASVIIHQGGSGTTGEALRAGRPMLVVPLWLGPTRQRISNRAIGSRSSASQEQVHRRARNRRGQAAPR